MTHRQYQVTVQDSGATSPPIQIGNVPNCLGWELSFSVQPGPNMVLEVSILCRDAWQDGGQGVTFGPFSVNVGGKLFVPYPSLELTSLDVIGLNVGNTSLIRILARPVLADGWSAASSEAVGRFTQTIAAAGTGIFQLPPMAISYKVTSSQAGPSRISLLDGTGAELSFWEIANPSDSSFDEGGQVWRQTSDPGSALSIFNAGIGAAILTVWVLFDFRHLK